MILHIWMHWFWITSLFCKGFLLRQILCAPFFVAEAGLPDTSFILNTENYIIPKVKLLKYTSHENDDDLRIRLKRTVEDEDGMDGATTTIVVSSVNETGSNEAPSGGGLYQSSDMGDTFNGGISDGLQYPLKKYTKYTEYSKFKLKPKTNDEDEEEVEEETGNLNTTMETVQLNETQTFENTTIIINSENQTFADDNNFNQTFRTVQNSTKDNTIDVQVSSTVSPVNVTEYNDPHGVTQIETNLTVESKLEESVIHTTVEPFIFNNRVAAATSSETRQRLSEPLDAGSITGITLGIVVISGFIGAVSFVLYRRRYLNKPQALNDKCSNLDSSGYIDDTSLRENSEEMYSLDNDSFLNSLEAMTIQNYWTENVKHTKL